MAKQTFVQLLSSSHTKTLRLKQQGGDRTLLAPASQTSKAQLMDLAALAITLIISGAHRLTPGPSGSEYCCIQVDFSGTTKPTRT